VLRLGWFGSRFSAADGAVRRRGIAVTAASAGAVLAAGTIVVAVGVPGSHAATMAPAAKTATSTKTARHAHADSPTVPLQIASVTPAAGARNVNGGQQIKVTFSEPLAANTPMPALSPRIPGTWQVSGSTAIFTPASGYLPHTRVTLKIPGGGTGVTADGATEATVPGAGVLASGTTESFTTGSYSSLRLQQLLSALGYLPLRWAAATTSPARSDANAQVSAAYSPPAGTFTWQSGYPAILRTFWHRGADSLIQQGAIRAFEYDHGLTMDGSAGPSVWRSLLADIASGKGNPHGYTYALASKSSPETLTIWHNGHVVLHTLANTGIPVVPTADGTFAVYLRYYYQIMKGTNPDGSKYADPVYYVAYFNGGDAVHYFPRASYGYPQSLGCVELPWDQAKVAWPYLTYGTLVTVAG